MAGEIITRGPFSTTGSAKPLAALCHALFGRPNPPTAAVAARTLAARAAQRRQSEEVSIAERRARIAAELRRSGAVSPLPPRDEVVAPIRAARALSKEKANG